MSKTYFLVQYSSTGSSSRGRLSGGIMLDLEDLFDENYMRGILRMRYTLMYGHSREYAKDIKSMKLEEFESTFSPEQIKKIVYLIKDLNIFRKEIYTKYSGVVKPKYKYITKLIPGHIYLDEDQKRRYLYLGDIHLIGYIDKELRADLRGNCFLEFWKSDTKINESGIRRYIYDIVEKPYNYNRTFLKGVKKVTKDLGDCGIDMDSLYGGKTVLPECYLYRYTRQLDYKIESNNKG